MILTTDLYLVINDYAHVEKLYKLIHTIGIGECIYFTRDGANALTSYTRLNQLEVMSCQHWQIRPFPISLKRIGWMGCGHITYFDLPIYLTHLHIERIELTPYPKLLILPDTLEVLLILNSTIIEFPILPAGLKVLSLNYNRTPMMPAHLPLKLEILDVTYSTVTILPILPSTLKRLFCSNTGITSLSILPNGLEVLSVGNCRIQTLTLPNITILDINDTDITHIDLPASLEIIYCSNIDIKEGKYTIRKDKFPQTNRYASFQDPLLSKKTSSNWRECFYQQTSTD